MPPLLVFRKLVSSLFLFRIIYWLFGGLLIIGVVYIFLTKRDLDLEWIVLGILGFGLWSSRHGLPLMVIFSLLGLGVLASIFLIQHPLLENWFNSMEQNDEPIWIEGKIRDYDLNLNKIFLVNVRLSNVEDEIDAEEMELLLPGKKFKRLHLYHGRNIHFYGRIRDHHEQGFRWKLELKQWGITPSNEVHSKIQRFRNRVGLLLMDRATFYFPADVFSIYLPLSLAKRRSSSSSARLFQQTGMAHLLAISGLHIALIYGLFYYLFKSLINFSLKMTEWVHQNLLIQLMALSFIWIYIFLLEWPVPALRATTMLSLMVLGNLLGLVQVPLFSLAMTSFIFLLAEPGMLHDLSFQLSFMAVLSILIFLPLYPSLRRADSLFEKCWKYVFSSFLMTSSVLLGIWPLISGTFNRVSLETFWLNLVMVPLLGTIVLPLCLLSLCMSLFYLGSPPYMPFEAEVFKLTEWGIHVWFSLMEELHQIGEWAVIKGRLDWSIQEYVLYYLVILLIGYGFVLWMPSRSIFNMRHGFRS